MKYCPRCRCQIPDGALDCEACITKLALASLANAQAEFLIKTVTGAYPLLIGCAAKGHRHILMYTSDRHTFCGLVLTKSARRSKAAYGDEAALATVCTGCRIALKSAIEVAQGARS